MNISSVAGIAISVIVFLTALLTSTQKAKIFLDTHAILIVIGGTLGASIVSFSFKRIKLLWKLFFRKVLGGEIDYIAVVEEIVDLARGYRENEAYLKTKGPTIKNPFLREAIVMMAEGGIDADDFDEILAKRSRTFYQRFEEDADNFRALAKFPPAFGLLGAVLGMISLMQNLGGADAFQKVGPSMAIALVATFYGIAIANFVFLPLAENISRINKRDFMVRQMICDGVKLIRKRKHPFMVEEALKSYLLPDERNPERKAS